MAQILYNEDNFESTYLRIEHYGILVIVMILILTEHPKNPHGTKYRTVISIFLDAKFIVFIFMEYS